MVEPLAGLLDMTGHLVDFVETLTHASYDLFLLLFGRKWNRRTCHVTLINAGLIYRVLSVPDQHESPLNGLEKVRDVPLASEACRAQPHHIRFKQGRHITLFNQKALTQMADAVHSIDDEISNVKTILLYIFVLGLYTLQLISAFRPANLIVIYSENWGTATISRLRQVKPVLRSRDGEMIYVRPNPFLRNVKQVFVCREVIRLGVSTLPPAGRLFPLCLVLRAIVFLPLLAPLLQDALQQLIRRFDVGMIRPPVRP